jgi:F-type H+-transporting ATPase subunit epsilon
MATFHFDLVAPARLVFAGDVTQVDVPGVDGDFGVLAGHAPLVATIKPGILTVFGGAEPVRYVVLGGFAEVSPEGMTVLADTAWPLPEADHGVIATRIQELEQSRDKPEKFDERKQLDRLMERLDQYRVLHRALQGGTAAH